MTLAATIDSLGPEAIRSAIDGDRAAVDQLLKALQRPFYNLALRMLGDRSVAEDATQECLLRVITHLSQYRAEARFGTWATRVAVNVILDLRGGRAREARMTLESFRGALETGRDEAATERPEDALLLKQAKTQCSRALLQCLDGDHRIAFVLGEILEFDAADASEILDLEPAAYRKRLSRARGELTAFLSRECSVHSAGRPCACHRRLDFAVASGRLDPARLEVHVADLAQLRTRLTLLDAEERTHGMYQGDEQPDLREQVLDSVRRLLFQVGTVTS
jgi:RNA polymerase sigma factor (sigma-70 family)